jgi:hypothetical protein
VYIKNPDIISVIRKVLSKKHWKPNRCIHKSNLNIWTNLFRRRKFSQNKYLFWQEMVWATFCFYFFTKSSGHPGRMNGDLSVLRFFEKSWLRLNPSRTASCYWIMGYWNNLQDDDLLHSFLCNGPCKRCYKFQISLCRGTLNIEQPDFS